jgi:hypothetical protein
MPIHLTRAKLPTLAAILAASALLLAATGGSHAAPRTLAAGDKSPEAIVHVHTVAKRDHRGGGSKTTSSAQGGVLVGGKETKVRRPPSCGYGCSLYGRASKAGNVRDHRRPRGKWGGK